MKDKKKEPKTYIGKFFEKDLDKDISIFNDIELSNKQLHFLKSYISGLHPAEIEKELGISNQEFLVIKSEIMETVFASNDFEMVQRAFLFRLIDREDFMNDSLKEIALNRAALAVSEQGFFKAKGLDQIAVVYNLLLSFYDEIEYNQLLLKLRIQ